jgi:flagellar motor switch protein FliM
LLGGGKDLTITPPGRPLTDIELRLASRITKLAISGLQNAWSTVADLKLHVSQVESNPQLVQIVPPNEVVVLVSFELTMGEVRGIVNLCIPFNTIEPLSGKLTSDSWSAYQKRQNDPRQRIYLQANTTRSTVPVIVRLAETKLTAEELASLAVGDVILTERDQQAGVEVVIGGSPLFAANPGLVKGHKAIRITRKIPRRKDAVAEELRKIGLDPGEPAIPELAG